MVIIVRIDSRTYSDHDAVALGEPLAEAVHVPR
jgi:hypothetical protein